MTFQLLINFANCWRARGFNNFASMTVTGTSLQSKTLQQEGAVWLYDKL